MLILALGAVVLGCVFLVVSFITENMAWAWGCIAACGVAAVILVVDTVRRGRSAGDLGGDTSVVSESSDTIVETPTELVPVISEESTAVIPAVAEPLGAAELDREPDEESIDSVDAFVVAGLSTEIAVVDERPRFHLTTCPWLEGKATLPLPVGEAVELGFTSCARCAPTATLAARTRER